MSRHAGDARRAARGAAAHVRRARSTSTGTHGQDRAPDRERLRRGRGQHARPSYRVVEKINEPRYPSFKGIMAAKKKPLTTHALADLGIAADEVGLGGSWSEVEEFARGPPRQAGTIVKDEGDGGVKLAEFLATRSSSERQGRHLMAEVLVLVEHADGAVKKVTPELLTLARSLGEPSRGVHRRTATSSAADKLAEYGARQGLRRRRRRARRLPRRAQGRGARAGRRAGVARPPC